jgi:hypothetical protein
MGMLRSFVRRLAVSAGVATPGPLEGVPSTTVAETTPCTPRSSERAAPRLNLLLPSINKRHYFGGIHTAVLLYRAMAPHFQHARIILLDSPPDAEAIQRFDDHHLIDADSDSDAPRQIVDFSNRYGRTLPVRPDDHWLATAWWSAYAAQRFAAWQAKEFGAPGRLTYLIQDFEPGFYPWSSQSAVALGTYRPDTDVAIFNTQLLSDYFSQNGMHFSKQCVFEPSINDGLRSALAATREAPVARKKRIVVYARPSTPRNAFELLCEGLRIWGWSDEACKDWEVTAVGELQSDMDLGPFTMKALGKMDIHAYADLLSTSAIGVSLMISPHPSYPPLEMAAFGMGVVTNRFANKDLSSFSANIRSIESFTPEAIADLVKQEVRAWTAREMLPARIFPIDHSFLVESHFDGIAEQAMRLQ